MDERVMQFRVGAMVLATLLITLILIVIFGEGPEVMKKRVTIHMVFTEAPMVMENTPVKKSGVVIGRVTKVSLMEDGRVRVSAMIDGDKPVFTTDVARISASLIGGDAVVNVEPGRKPAPRERVGEAAELPGVGYADPIQVIANLQDRLAGAIGSVTNTSNELGQVVHQVGILLQTNQEKINRILTQADESTRDVKELVRTMNDAVGTPESRAKIKDAIDQAPELIRTTRETIGQFSKIINGLDKNLQNVDKFTTALGDQGQVMITRLSQSSEKFDRLMDELVVRQVLQVLEPAAVELALEAEARIPREQDRLERPWQQELERAQYKTQRARRRARVDQHRRTAVAHQQRVSLADVHRDDPRLREPGLDGFADTGQPRIRLSHAAVLARTG